MRRGLLGKGSQLTVSSQPGRTSPVQRGKWLLQTFLGVSPPSPPPGVVIRIASTEKDAHGGTKLVDARADGGAPHDGAVQELPQDHGPDRLRAGELRRHRHSGARRTAAPRSMRPASWWTARRWTASPALREVADRYSPQFVRVATEKLLTYALGRGVEYYDMPLVRSIVRDAAPAQLPLLLAGPRRRQEPAVPDERRATQVPSTCRSRQQTREATDERSSPRSICRAARSCAVPASRSRCRCSTRWCRRGRWPGSRAALTKTRFAGIFVPHGDGARVTGCRRRQGAGFELPVDHDAARAVPRSRR